MPIKSDDTCIECFYDTENPGCHGKSCAECEHYERKVSGKSERRTCLCCLVLYGDPCPYFKPLHPTEHTEETDYDEMLHTFF